MFARAVGVPARNSAVYICQACRHERVLNARQTQLQRRSSSESTRQKASAAEGADDWILPLNGLSDDFGGENNPTRSESIKARRVEIRPNASGGAASKANGVGEQTLKPRRSERRRAFRRPLSGSNRRVDVSELPQSSERANDSGSRTSSLREDVPLAAETLKPGSRAARQTPPTPGSAEMQKLWDQLGPDIQQGIDALAADNNATNNETQYDEYLEKSAAVSVPEPALKSKEPVPFPSFSPKESTSTPMALPSFISSAVKYVREKVGLSKSSLQRNAASNNVAVPRSSFVAQNSTITPDNVGSDGTDQGSNVRQLSAKRSHRAETVFDTLEVARNVAADEYKRPVERWAESSTRQPWGPSGTDTPDRTVASFTDIASADRASIKQPVTTSFSNKPYGIEPAQTLAALRGNPAQSLSKSNDASPVSNAAENKPTSDAAITSSALDTAVASRSDAAHSRLSGLYATRDDTEQTVAEQSPDAMDTLDLAYLRKQYYQDRAQQDIRASTQRTSSDLPPAGQDLDQAVNAEVKGVEEDKLKAVPETSRPKIRYHSGPVTVGPDLKGLSLVAALLAEKQISKTPSGSKNRAGRPSKESAASRSKPRAHERISIPELPPPERPTTPSKTVDESSPAPDVSVDGFRTITPSALHITPLDIPQPPVPYLQYGLDRVLFNPGVYQLQDQVSRVYNFDPYLQNIMPNIEFDFDSLKEYKTSSKDEALAKIARDHGNKYIGSTSSMTSVLGHFHYLLSNWRPLNYGMLSHNFASSKLSDQVTQINRAPSAIFLRWKNGTYAIDADKEHDNANVLMLLGKSMELLLTLPKSDFERYRKSDPRKVSEEQRTAPESYQYTTMRDFLMRSQLDAYDPRLPGNGTFDLKTRAVVSVRMAADDHEPMTGYEIYAQQGKWGSYEKEYYDMIRSTMLKYMLQARMGRMNGIFIAYHNVERIFGFQYVPIADMDLALHGQTDPSLGDQEFRASLDMLNDALNAATAKFPEQSLRIHFETKVAEKGDEGMPTALHVFAEPMSEEECDKIQDSQKAKIAEWEKKVMGKNDADAEDVAEPSLTADELAGSGLANEVSQDDAAIDDHESAEGLEINEDVVITASQDDVQDSANSLFHSSEQSSSDEAANATTDNSSSNADPKFLNALAESDGLKPLFYATIIAQSSVNGDVKERASHLTSTDEWTIDYILKEYDIGRHQWALYEDLKARRRMSYGREEEDEAGGKEESHFINFLRKMSEKGRALRKAKDAEEVGKPVVKVEDLDMERLDKVDSVDDYMRFLEKPKESATGEMFG